MMQIGIVKRWNDAKGYGFITPEHGAAEVFVHHRQIVGHGRKTLLEGQRVRFDVVKGVKGLEARHVEPL
jgi:CspA family cold shock protein